MESGYRLKSSFRPYKEVFACLVYLSEMNNNTHKKNKRKKSQEHKFYLNENTKYNPDIVQFELDFICNYEILDSNFSKQLDLRVKPELRTQIYNEK